MLRLKFSFLGLFLVFLASPAFAFLENTPHQYTLGANYSFNTQNPFGDFPVFSFNFAFTPSVVIRDTHEIGVNLSYNGTKQSNSITNTSTSTSQTNIGPYYRYNFSMTGPDAKIPVIAYVGPQFGMTTVSAPTTTGASASSTDLSVGGQFGMNFAVSKNVAVNFHAFQWDTVFAKETQLIITQSIGIRYYFE